ncbi:MAG: arginase family protein [Blautia sp.]|nr:arginase family protein [Blautia sp.]
MQCDVVVMNFSGVYEKGCFYKKQLNTDSDLYKSHIVRLDCKDIDGTNCYCDDAAKTVILSRISPYTDSAIHFIDSGNYHYLSRLWIERIKEPFQLIVFDHHTDMQPPAFGDILSCGGWILDAFDGVPDLKRLVLIGPSEEDFRDVEERLQKNTIYISENKIYESADRIENMFTEGDTNETNSGALTLPIYISIDKDILSKDELQTNWSQGSLSTDQLILCLTHILDYAKEQSIRILGIDICGESAPEEQYQEASDEINMRIFSACKRIMI